MANTESIQVKTEDLYDAAKKIDDEADIYKTTYTKLLQKVEDFTTSDFKGDDADAFRNQVNRFNDDFVKMKDLMNEYAAALRDFAKNYEETQRNVKNHAQGLQN